MEGLEESERGIEFKGRSVVARRYEGKCLGDHHRGRPT